MTTYRSGDGAAAGEFKMTVVLNVAAADPAPEEAHRTDPGFEPPASAHFVEVGKKASGSLVPAQYNDASQTPLKAKIEPNGANKFTFDLK